MKKVDNNFKIIIITFFAIIVGLLVPSISKAATFNSNVSNYVDNLCRVGEQIILPIALKTSDDTVTAEKISKDFSDKGLTVKSISKETIGTGTEITVNENAHKYIVLIYGDVNGDGEVNTGDARRIMAYVIDNENKALTGVYLMAANVANKGNEEVNTGDARRIMNFFITPSGYSILAENPTIELADVIIKVERSSNPTKTTYNYGEDIEVAGAKIKVTWLSGKIETINVTNAMLDAYDLSTPGQKTIRGRYEGQQFSFNITVLNKISGLEITSTGRTNSEAAGTVFTTRSKEDFVLGAIRETQVANTSKLKNSQLTISITESNISENLTLSTEVDTSGNILVKGKAEVSGTYYAKLAIRYGTQEVALNITINAQRNTTAKSVSLAAVTDGEVRINSVNPVEKRLTVTNIHDEEIDVSSARITIDNVVGHTGTNQLDKDNYPIQNTTTPVKYIRITTTSTTAETAGFKITIDNSAAGVADVSTTVSYTTGDKLVVSRIELGATKLQLYKEANANTKTDTEGQIYTLVPVRFYSTIGTEEVQINVEYDDMTTSNLANKIKVVLPKITGVESYDEEEHEWVNTSPTTPRIATAAKYYDENETEVGSASNSYITSIGIAILNNATTRVPNTDGLNATTFKIEYNTTTLASIPVEVVEPEP